MRDAAICFTGEESERVGSLFYGRVEANVGLLTAWARYGTGDVLNCVTPTPEDGRKLRELLNHHGLSQRPLVQHDSYVHVLPQRGLGTLFRLDPNLTDMLWARRMYGAERAFSICGLTYTLSSNSVFEWISNLTIAPAWSWDALICISRAARNVVEELCEQWREYFCERIGATRRSPILLPVIPLGINAASIAHDPARRARLRARLGIGEDDVTLLFSGRLSYFEKAHPAPMFVAAELAQSRTKRRLHLLLAGRFPEAAHSDMYRREAAALAPSVTLHFLDGADSELYISARSAADIFFSLSDNVQETFGLTPVEAMAAGLPVVASDWDGYRDTIEDGVTGALVPVIMGQPGSGDWIGTEYYQGKDYYRFLGRVSQRVAADLSVAASVIAALADDPARRRAMGRAGQERVRRYYDWSVVIPQYEELWAELRHRRETAIRTGSILPLAPDPFRLYRSFATASPDHSWTVRLLEGWRARFASLQTDEMALTYAPAVTDAAVLEVTLAQFDQPVPVTIAQVLNDIPSDSHNSTIHLLLWLMKMGILRLVPPRPC